MVWAMKLTWNDLDNVVEVFLGFLYTSEMPPQLPVAVARLNRCNSIVADGSTLDSNWIDEPVSLDPCNARMLASAWRSLQPRSLSMRRSDRSDTNLPQSMIQFWTDSPCYYIIQEQIDPSLEHGLIATWLPTPFSSSVLASLVSPSARH